MTDSTGLTSGVVLKVKSLLEIDNHSFFAPIPCENCGKCICSKHFHSLFLSEKNGSNF